MLWGHPSRRPTQVGFSRLGHYKLPISGKPEIGGPPQDEVPSLWRVTTVLMVRSVAEATRLEPWASTRDSAQILWLCNLGRAKGNGARRIVNGDQIRPPARKPYPACP